MSDSTNLDGDPFLTPAGIAVAQRSPGKFALTCGRGAFTYAKVHRALDAALVDAVAADEGRLIVSVTVRAGKSTLAARWTPAWFLGRFPDRRVMLACHEVGLAAEHAGAARDILTEFGPDVFGVEVDPTSSARHRWDIAGRAGGMLALGVGGSPIGRGADLLLVDDPIKSWEMAQNAEQRRKVNEVWWQGTMSSRLEPGATVVVICSRWHEDDLSGFLQREYPGDWKELRIPALCDDPDTDPLDRDLGESFWPERWPAPLLNRRRSEVSQRVWLAQYQQTPTTQGGDDFPTDRLVYVDRVDEDDVQWCRGWDLAATAGAGDWTVGGKIGRYRSTGRWVIGDIVRGQLAEHDVRTTILGTANQDGPACLVELPQDPGQAGKAQAAQLVAALSGYLVESRPQTGSKEVRAAGLAAQVQAGNVDVVRATWNRDLTDEMAVFPNGVHDDQVDALAVAFNRLAAIPTAPAGAGSGAFAGLTRRS